MAHCKCLRINSKDQTRYLFTTDHVYFNLGDCLHFVLQLFLFLQFVEVFLLSFIFGLKSETCKQNELLQIDSVTVEVFLPERVRSVSKRKKKKKKRMIYLRGLRHIFCVVHWVKVANNASLLVASPFQNILKKIWALIHSSPPTQLQHVAISLQVTFFPPGNLGLLSQIPVLKFAFFSF